MPHTLWLLCLTLSTVLFAEKLVNGKRIRISPSTRVGSQLVSFTDAERTNYTLVFSRSAQVLEKLLVIDQVTGIVTLNRKINCDIFHNKIFVVILRSASVQLPRVLFYTPILVTLHNRHACLIDRTDKLNSYNAIKHKQISADKKHEFVFFNKSSGVLTKRREVGDQLRLKNDISNRVYKFNIRTKSGSNYFSNRLKRDVSDVIGYQKIQPETAYSVRVKRNTINNAPTFSKLSDQVNVREDVNVSTLVYTASATDTDRFLAGKLVYSMKPMGNILSQDFFNIDPGTGKIRNTALLDRETMARHQFRVKATDNGKPPLQATMILTIVVLDVNDHAPVFDKKVYRENISELKDTGSTVLAVRAYDSDDRGNKIIRYSIVSHSGTGAVFTIDKVSGIIRVSDELDREKVSSYHLVVQAQDQGKPPLSSTVNVYINLLDENDCSPVFNQSIYSFFVAENSIRGTFVGRTNATDCDIGLNSKIRYAISSGDGQVFKIGTNSGIIRVKGSLDYETISQYTLNVLAEDYGEDSEFNNVWVDIEVTDVNDSPPEFSRDEYRFRIVEDKGKDSLVGTVRATDRDSNENAEIEYFLRSKNVPFTIGLTSGEIKTAGKLDRETVPKYQLEVVAQDKGTPPLKKSVSVYVDVEDVNDSPPLFEKTTYNATINENYSSRRPFLTVAAKDKDTIGQIKYSIKEEPYNCFAINSFGGITIQRSCSLDYKMKNTYYFKVEASDGQQSSTVQVVVHIQDANDNSPEFTESRYTGQIYENDTAGTTVAQVKATDDDFGKNAEITYSIRGGSNVFKIDPHTGVITNLVKLDRELTPKYRLIVVATDNGEWKRFGRTRVDITVKDINDNVPQFEKSLYQVEIDENVHVGNLVKQIKATDKDEGPNKQISYSLEKKGNINDAFKINKDLGDITVNKKLDREVTPEYVLTVVATDHGKPPQHSTTQVKIILRDIVDSPPKFEKSPYIIAVREDFPLKKELIRVKAVTQDTVKHANIQYDITGGNYDNIFTIFGSSGSIELVKSLDFESKTSYRLTVQAMYASYLASAEVYINVVDVNDMKPILAHNFEILINTREGQFPTNINFKIPAYDPDKSSKLTYVITLKNDRAKNAVTVDKNTGILSIKESALANTNRIQFSVQVEDGVHTIIRSGSINLNIITDPLLQASVPVYLKNATASKFFEVLRKFKIRLGKIFGVQGNDVIVFYVVNTTRTHTKFLEGIGYVTVPDNFLTIWLAVRNGEGFIEGKLVLEKLFFNVTQLEVETQMVVLPSDKEIKKGKDSNHFLLVREACKTSENSFRTCMINKTFVDSPGQLLITPYAVFYGVKVREVLRPVCSAGFYGTSCTLRLDACYSSPCFNQAKCVNYEGGYYCACADNYVGKNCKIDTRKSRCSTTQDNICRNKGVCENNPKQGFRCKCQNENYESPLCHLTTRSFENGSFAAFPGLNQKWHIEISLEFATIHPDGILVYVGRYGHENDSMALELRDGKLYYVFSAGDDVQTVSVGPDKGKSIVNGTWQKVTISYQQRTGALVLGENCKSAVAVKFGSQVGTFSCAAAKKLNGKLRSMDLTFPLLLGGLSFTPSSFPIQGHSFNGCIRNVKLNHAPLDMGSPIFNRNSRIGCGRKRDFCTKDLCGKNGKCVSSWDEATCVCEEEYVGKRCEIKTTPLDFTSKSYLVNKLNTVIELPWTMSVSFRTVHSTGTLLKLVSANSTSLLQFQDANLRYTHSTMNVQSNNVILNDGKWHHVKITRSAKSAYMIIDHVYKIEVNLTGSMEAGESLTEVTLGDTEKSGNGFNGCIKGLMIAGSQLSLVSSTTYLVTNGCDSKATCKANTCPRVSTDCKEGWRNTSCVCLNGFVGESCRDICSLRPCQNGATCQRVDDPVGFKCICPDKYLGQFCETKSQLPCRDEFFSASDSGTCGPCNCDLRLEYNPVCNKRTGECYCKERYFRAILGRGKLDEVCEECRCDPLGSKNQMCEPIGGQCPCLPGVIGRVCDMCQAKQGEITQGRKGCKIINTSCPRAKAERINWPRENFGVLSVQKCPYGAQGTARRLCAFGKGWQDPDLSNCTSRGFVDIVKSLKRYGNLTTQTAIIISHEMWNMFSWKEFYQKDVALGYEVILALLDFESNQVEDKLASSQDKKFLDIILQAISIFVDPKYTQGWSWIVKTPPATVSLMRELELFGISLASNMIYIKRKEYRGKRSISSLPSYNKVENNLLMQLEPVNPKQFAGLTFPLVEHESSLLSSDQWRNTSNRVEIPASLFRNPGAPKDESAIAFIALKYLGDLLPHSFDTKASSSDVSLDVNSDVIIVGIKGMESIYLQEPITIEFEIHEVNRSQYDCVFWNYSIPGTHGGGWSRNGCTKAPSNFTHTVCKCHHLTSFAVVSDLRIEIPVISPYTIQIVTYIGVGVSLVILLAAIISFTCLSGLNSNTNTIHRNMVLTIVIAEVVYVFGINRTSNTLICRFIAIVLHYFFDAVFAWMFVEVIHMYRRLTEKRDIDSGQMTFYYFLGWGCPAIVVGLSTGMAVEGYGNERFCWMTTNGTLIWTFTLPIITVIFANVIVFLMALRLSVQKARRRRKHQAYHPKNAPVTSVYKNALKIRYALKVGVTFLPVVCVTISFGLLAVNEDLLVFHYLFAVLCCCQSLFVLLFYVAFDQKVREEYKNAFIRWKTGDKTYGRPRQRRVYEMSYHPGSNLAGEDGYGLKGMNPETTSTDRSTSTLHSTSMTRTSKTDPFSTFPEDDSESDYKEIRKRKPRKDDPVDMESAAKMWNAPEKSEVSTTQPESSDSSDGGRRRETMVISSDTGSSGDESGSWEQKSENGVHKPKVTAPLYASDGPMHSTPLELEQEKTRLLKKKPQTETPVATVEPLPRPKIPSILKNSKGRGNESPPAQPSPQTSTKPVPEMKKAGSEASSGSSLSSLSDDENNLVLQAKLLSQSTEGGMSMTSSQAKKRRSRKTRDLKHGKTSRHHRVHFHRKNQDDAQKLRVRTVEGEEGKPLTEHHV